ncbi:MAG: alkaline phosphatase family protein [Tepidisphaeraceae bacterium]|jgi:hypothetical protein
MRFGSWKLAGLAAATIFGFAPLFAFAQPAKHVIIISIDGLHQADLSDAALTDQIPRITALLQSSVEYTQAATSTPSDSFPGTLAYLTGAGPATTGVYYDESYSRTLIPAGGSASSPRGAFVANTEALDKNAQLISGGGDCGVQSIDPSKLPLDASGAPAFPHSYLKVNTIFEIVHAAGLRTSMIDKHPAYEIAAGPSGKGIDDLYCPEIEAKCVLTDGKLDDSAGDDADPKPKVISKSVPLAMAYDDMHLAALMNELGGRDARGDAAAPVPGLIVINLQAVNVAEKFKKGGILVLDGTETPTKVMKQALNHTDTVIGAIVDKLKSDGLWDQTLIVLTAKHGQNPRVGTLTTVNPSVLLDPLKAAGIQVARATIDDLAILWLADPTQAGKAAQIEEGLKTSNPDAGIDRVLWGDSLKAAGLVGYPDRTPDLIVALKPGVVISEKAKRSEHGGFCEDDTHVPLILTGGVVDAKSRATTVDLPVKTTQIAVTVIDAMGLNSADLQGAQIDKTQALPSSGLENIDPPKAAN